MEKNVTRTRKLVLTAALSALIIVLGITPLLCLEGVPGLPGAPQDEAGLRRKLETSHV